MYKCKDKKIRYILLYNLSWTVLSLFTIYLLPCWDTSQSSLPLFSRQFCHRKESVYVIEWRVLIISSKITHISIFSLIILITWIVIIIMSYCGGFGHNKKVLRYNESPHSNNNCNFFAHQMISFEFYKLIASK